MDEDLEYDLDVTVELTGYQLACLAAAGQRVLADLQEQPSPGGTLVHDRRMTIRCLRAAVARLRQAEATAEAAASAAAEGGDQ